MRDVDRIVERGSGPILYQMMENAGLVVIRKHGRVVYNRLAEDVTSA